MQHEDSVEADGHARQLRAALGKGTVAVVDQRAFQNVVGLHQHLDRQFGGQNLVQHVLLGTGECAGLDAHQRIGEQRQFVADQSVLAEGVKDGVMFRFAVFTPDFEFGDGDGAASSTALGSRSR